ncbi:hypothetical protein LXL04_010452 [Taraxacum kok-saghyz]
MQYNEYGTKESILLFESCFHHFKIYKKGLKSLHLEPPVASLFKKLMEKPHFCKVFTGLVENTNTTINEEFLDDLSTALKLSPFEKLGFGFALSNSENNNVRIAGRNFCMAQLKELCINLKTPQNLIQHEISSTVLPLLLKDAEMSEPVLDLWNANPPFFSRALNALLTLNPENMHKIVELLQESEVFQEQTALLSQLSKEMERLQITYTDNSPIIENISDPDTSAFEEVDNIEAEANAYFQQMFSGELTIGAMVQMLMRFKRSSEKREQLVLEYMINNLLQVNESFNKYADDNFKQVYALFGSLIRHQVVSDSTLTIALQIVLDALHEPAISKIFFFGIHALENYVDRLIEWPEYCQKVLQISQLRDTHPELVSIIEHTLSRTSCGLRESDKAHNASTDLQHSSIPPRTNVQMSGSYLPLTIDWSHLGSQVSSPTHLQQRNESHSDDKQKASLTPSSRPNPNLSPSRPVSVTTLSGSPQSGVRYSSLTASSPEFSPPSRAITSTGTFEKTLFLIHLLLSLYASPSQAPPSKTQDTISFIVNTLSDANTEAKVKEFTKILEEQYYPWFAQYIVMNRVSTEPNFHMLYINFLEKANSKQLMGEILRETYENCKVLLRSELIQSSTEERALLKNFGGWLGKITIGRNKVLLRKHIDPKSLVIEVLEPCKGSLAYQPPNPWSTAILGLLAEIHAMPNLKINLSFSIEILFKNLDLDIKTVTPTSLLKDRVRKIEGNPDFSNKDVGPCKQITQRSNVTQGELPQKATGPSYQGEDIKLLFQRMLPMVMDTAIKEIVSTIVEKSVYIATQTTMALVLKECVTESDENYIQSESCSIIVCLVGNLSYVTSKEPLRKKLSSQLRICLQSLNIASEPLEHDLQRVIDDNLELGCGSIEKAAIEKGLIIVKKEIAHHLSIRRKQREGSRPPTFDPILHGQGNVSAFEPRLPAPPSHVLAPSNIANELLGVHQQTFLPTSTSNRYIENPLTAGAALDAYQILEKKIKGLISKDAEEAEIQSVIAEVPVAILRCINKDEAAFSVAETVFEGLYEIEANNAHINAHIAILAAVCDVSKLVGRELTNWVLHSDDEKKFNKNITVGLIHRELLNLTKYDSHMAKLIGSRKSTGAATEFCISLVRTLEAIDPRLLSTLQNVVNTLAKVANYLVAKRDDDGPLISSKPDPPGFHFQVAILFADWLEIHDHPDVSDETRAHYVSELNRILFSKGDDLLDRFFHHHLEPAVSYCLSSKENVEDEHEHEDEDEDKYEEEDVDEDEDEDEDEDGYEDVGEDADISPFVAIDVYAELVFSILKFCPVDKGLNKLTVFSKVSAVIVRAIKKDAQEKKESFNSTPYFRLFTNFFNNLDTLDSNTDDENFQILAAISNLFHALQPIKVPAFSFTWVELISHKDFMPKLFALNGRKGWPYFKQLFVDLLQFMEPFLRNGELTDPVRVLYKGALKVLLVLVHDFPEFICYYHFNFCQVIASRCVHMRNIILSTFPHNMRLPDPTAPNLKVDLLPEISQPPCIDHEFAAALKANNMKDDVDEYLMMRPKVSSFLFGLTHKLLLSSNVAKSSGTFYNVPLMNSLVLYVGTKAIQQMQASTASDETSIARFVSLIVFFAGAALDIFRTLILNLDSEGRYLFFNAVADQLRYPNNHTHFFSFVILHFFIEIKEEVIQEQITRVLLERLITKAPHPWGLQVTFLELVKNNRYNFWSLNFTRSDPEIKTVFDSVSTSLGI